MIDQQTIDRCDVGLAELAINHGSLLFRKSTGRDAPSLNTPGELLCLHLGIPEPIPYWAERALEGHHGTPEQLVQALRELAKEKPPLRNRSFEPDFRLGETE